MVQADADEEIPRRNADYVTSVLRDLGVTVIGQMAEGGLGGPRDAAARPELLERARGLGRELAAA